MDSIVKPLVSELHSLIEKEYPNIYMLSLAVLFDDIFDINFSDRLEKLHSSWYQHSYLKKGYISHCCKEAQKNIKKVFILKDKKQMALAPQLTQRVLFQEDINMQSFCVAPIIIGAHIIGSIQLSLKNPLNNDEINKINTFLIWLADKITWLLFSEQMRLSSILELAKTTIHALESKESFQAYHSRNVAILVNAFICLINRHSEYKNLLFRSNKNVTGFSFVKLKLAALLHDIGKFSMSNVSFEAKDIKNLKDYCKRKLHPFFTFNILNSSQMTKSLAITAASHHERMDNFGSPFGIPGRELSVENQIISFADKFDSIARERPSKDARSVFDKVINKLLKDKVKNAFSEEIYNALLCILMEFKDNPETAPSQVLELLGMPPKPKNKKLDTKTELDRLFQDSIIKLNKIRRNQWLVILAISFEKDILIREGIKTNINIKSADGIDTDIFKIKCAIAKISTGRGWEKYNWAWNMFITKAKRQKKIYIGIHKPPGYKERAYAFCEDLADRIPQNSKMVAVFLDRTKFLKKDSLLNYRNNLIETLKKMRDGDRWRLLSQ